MCFTQPELTLDDLFHCPVYLKYADSDKYFFMAPVEIVNLNSLSIPCKLEYNLTSFWQSNFIQSSKKKILAKQHQQPVCSSAFLELSSLGPSDDTVSTSPEVPQSTGIMFYVGQRSKKGRQGPTMISGHRIHMVLLSLSSNRFQKGT